MVIGLFKISCAGEMAQSVRQLAEPVWDLSSNLQHSHKKPGVAVHTRAYGTVGVESGGIPGLVGHCVSPGSETDSSKGIKQRPIPDILLWLLNVHMAACTHRHTCSKGSL